MKCKATASSTRGKTLSIDCTKCSSSGSLDNPVCMATAMELLKRNRADEIMFVKKDFRELYRKDEVSLLTGLIDAVKKFEEDKIWTTLKCDVKENEDKYRGFIQETLAGFYSHPVKAYQMLEGLMKKYREKTRYLENVIYDYKCDISKDRPLDKDLLSYIEIMEKITSEIEKTKFVKILLEGTLKEHMKPVVQPTFVRSFVDLKFPDKSDLLSFYKVAGADIRIYERDGDKIYFVNPPEVWLYPNQVNLLARLNEYISREHSLEVFDPKEAREYFRKVGDENLPKLAQDVSKEEIRRLSEIFARYSAGYGLLEILFRDKHIYDIYVDSPPGSTPVYIIHEKYGSCVTNIYLTEEDMERLSSKFRAISERPFDEANPILDMDLRDVGVRVAGLREPSTFEGLAYAFRKHRENPWTLAKFVQKGMLGARSAALLSMLISGQCAMLITGARGAGKTSLLASLIAEVDQRDRIILMEDTAEIPSKALRDNGWKIEHLKNQAAIAHKKGYELAPEENLRAALRLGESVLVQGEVRGQEARVLFEAMRVGAAGNSVLGTIHGSSPYDTWDRITNDLHVPPTSFKAVDIIVSLRYREVGADSGKARRVMQVTEVRKKWVNNPEEEGAFFDLMKFNEYSEKEEFNFAESEVIKSICLRKGLSMKEFEEIISIREKIIEELIKASDSFEDVLEIGHVTEVNKRYRFLYHKNEIKEIYPEWDKWFREYFGGVLKGQEDEVFLTMENQAVQEKPFSKLPTGLPTGISRPVQGSSVNV